MTKIYVTQNLNFVLGRVENILGKGENYGYQHFLLFAKCFQTASFSGVVRSWDHVVKGYPNFCDYHQQQYVHTICSAVKNNCKMGN